MSFSSEIKNKLSAVKLDCIGCIAAECAGALGFTGAAGDEGIFFRTENEIVINRIANDIAEAFGIKAAVSFNGNRYKLSVADENETDNVLSLITSDNLMPFECCKASYVRGAFIGSGSVNDPRKSYHMEFSARSREGAEKLLQILADNGFYAKIAERKGRYIVYIKECDTIADILGYIGAPQNALELFNVEIEKQMNNQLNRRVNCESANTDKSYKASALQLAAIKKLRDCGKLSELPEALRETAMLKEAHPDADLKTLGEMSNPTIGKSGINHRMRRIMEKAESL